MSRAVSFVALAAVVAPLALAACQSLLPVPTAGDAARSNVTVERLAEGRTRYTDKCSSCHAPFAPSYLTAAAWPKRVDEMAGPAHLEPADRELIVAYLQAFADKGSARR